jgi:hypothetical protein
MSSDLTRRNMSIDPWKAAEAFKASGMFPDLKSEAQAYVKILAGEELGIAPMAAIGGIHVIQGKATLSANLLATLVKRHPAYDYKVTAHDDKVCRIEFFQNGEVNGVSEFTAEDAKRAGLGGKNWTAYPQAMMFARALTQGVRWYCPDVTAGSAAYTPEELGAEIEPRPIDDLAALMSEHGFSTEDKAGIRDWLKAEPERKDEKISDAIALLENGETDGLRVCAGFDAETVNGEVVK